MSSRDPITAKFLGAPPESADPDIETEAGVFSASSRDNRRKAGMALVLIGLVLFGVAGFLCYSQLGTTKKAGEKPSDASQFNLSDVFSWAFGSERGTERMQKQLQRMQEDGVTDVQRQMNTEQNRKLQQQLQDAASSMEKFRQSGPQFDQRNSRAFRK